MLTGVLQLPVPPALLEISSLNRLMSIASRIVGRDLAHESQEAAAQRWRAWQSAASALGLTSQHLAVALSAQSKALMVHMHMAARHGSGRVSFKVMYTSDRPFGVLHSPCGSAGPCSTTLLLCIMQPSALILYMLSLRPLKRRVLQHLAFALLLHFQVLMICMCVPAAAAGGCVANPSQPLVCKQHHAARSLRMGSVQAFCASAQHRTSRTLTH